MARQPNIVFIMADQLGAAHLGCYGSPVNATPNLDALAGRGIRFHRCYASVPLCAPNRATLLTGRSPVVHGVTHNERSLPNDTPTYAHCLQAQGYHTGGFGKFHVTPMQMTSLNEAGFVGFDESWVTEDPKWEWAEWVCKNHPEHAEAALSLCWTFWPWPEHPLRSKAEAAVEKLLKPRQAASPHRIAYTSPVPAHLHDTAVITDFGLDYMARRLDQHPDRPFFCHLSYVDPHDPYDPPEPYASMFKAEDMPPAKPQEWDPAERPCLASAKKFAQFDQCGNDPAVIREIRAKFNGSIKLMDDQIQRVVDFLHQRGIWDNTILVFTTDHGDLLGDHGLPTKGVKPYDASVRCPLIVAGGGVEPAVVDRLVCTLDFLPSFCDLAGIDAAGRPPIEGISFAPECFGRAAEDPHQSVLVSFDAMQSVFSDEGWRLTLYDGEKGGQLVNLREDPDEQQNRYEDPACAAKREHLLRELVRLRNAPLYPPQYRTMPAFEGRRWQGGRRGQSSCPDLPLPRSPVL
jgi:arylsulfatase A-like enzyme